MLYALQNVSLKALRFLLYVAVDRTRTQKNLFIIMKGSIKIKTKKCMCVCVCVYFLRLIERHLFAD